VNYERNKKGARFFETQCSNLHKKMHIPQPKEQQWDSGW